MMNAGKTGQETKAVRGTVDYDGNYNYHPSQWEFSLLVGEASEVVRVPITGNELQQRLTSKEKIVTRDFQLLLLMARPQESISSSIPDLSLTDIIDYLDLPVAYLDLHLPGAYIGCGNFFHRFSCDRDNKLSSIATVVHFPLQLEGITPASNEAYLSCCFRYDTQSKRTTGLIYGASRSFEQQYLSYLNRVRALLQHPLSHLVLIFDLVVGQSFNLWKADKMRVWEMEVEAGICYQGYRRNPWSWNTEKFKDEIRLNFQTMTNLHHLQRLLDFEESLADFLLETALRLENDYQFGGCSPSSRIVKEIEDTIRNCRNVIRNHNQQAKKLETRTKNLLDIILAITAQKANEISHKQGDYMEKISIATKRDSSSMITLALLTMLFLPSTFVSSLFSTGMFNFEASSMATILSSWFWLYWAISIPLTFVIVGSWVIWYNFTRRNQNIN